MRCTPAEARKTGDERVSGTKGCQGPLFCAERRDQRFLTPFPPQDRVAGAQDVGADVAEALAERVGDGHLVAGAVAVAVAGVLIEHVGIGGRLAPGVGVGAAATRSAVGLLPDMLRM